MVGYVIRILRDEQGWTQSELAERARLDPITVSHYETGRRRPSLRNAVKLADAFGVSLDHLVGRDGFGEVIRRQRIDTLKAELAALEEEA